MKSDTAISIRLRKFVESKYRLKYIIYALRIPVYRARNVCVYVR